MNNQIFISFSSKDQDKANHIVEFLEKNNFKCFISSRDLIAGQEYAGQLIDNITCASAVVLLMSETSNESPHVLREVECAVSKRIPIFVYALEDVTLSKSMSYYLMTHQWIPVGWEQDARLLEGLNKLEKVAKISDSDTTATDITATDKSTAGTADEGTAHKVIPQTKKRNVPVIIAAAAVGGLLLAGGITLAVMGISGKLTKNPKEAEQTEEVNDGELEPGTIVAFGSYLDNPIQWIILKSDAETYTLVSANILCMKCYDAAEGGEYGYYGGVDYYSYENHIIEDPLLVTKVRGNNDWSKSNLRTWLNSDKGIVKYEDQAPCLEAVTANAYDYEAGFLNGFDEGEKEAMVPVTIQTPVNSLNNEASNGMITTTDLVYLLSSEELKWFEDIDMHIFAKPTPEAVSNNKDNEGYGTFSKEYKTENYFYWLRDCDTADYVNMAYAATTELQTETTFFSDSVGAHSYGVRPVITVRKEYFIGR